MNTLEVHVKFVKKHIQIQRACTNASIPIVQVNKKLLDGQKPLPPKFNGQGYKNRYKAKTKSRKFHALCVKISTVQEYNTWTVFSFLFY